MGCGQRIPVLREVTAATTRYGLDTGVEMRWHIAGANNTRTQLQVACFTLTEEWVVDEDKHWMFLTAELSN